MTSIRSFIQRLINKETGITIVSGLPRSGTSMMMAALEAGGMTLITDHIRCADGNNPKGYFEFEQVKKLPHGEISWLKNAQGKAVKVISALLKYLPDTYRYKVLFLERDIEEILASQKRMLERTGTKEEHPISDVDMGQALQDHVAQVKSWIKEQDWVQMFPVRYNLILQNPQKEFLKVVNFLELPLDVLSMVKIVDPALYRERNN